MADIKKLKLQVKALSKLGLDTSHLQEQLDKPEPSAISNNPSTELAEPNLPVQVAPTIQDIDALEKELNELIDQLKKVNRHWKIEWAREKGVPMKALLHATHLWLSNDTRDWSAANDTIFQFTSHWGNMQLCHRCLGKFVSH